MEDLCYEFILMRNRRFDSVVPKKRHNKKEARDRQNAINKRNFQREMHQDEVESERKHLEELNCGLDPDYLRKQQAREQALTRKEENRRLYLEAMVRDTVGNRPTGLSAAKQEAYTRLEAEAVRLFKSAPRQKFAWEGQGRLLSALRRELAV